MKRPLFSADPIAGNGNNPPPAAQTVVTGTKTEAELKLERELKDERASHASTAAEKKARETRIAELEDELHRLKQVQTPAPTPPKPKSAIRQFMGWEDED